MVFNGNAKWLPPTTVATIATLAVLSASAAISVYLCKRKSKLMARKIKELEASLNSSMEKCASERQGRVRAQKALRDVLAKPKSESLENASYPMMPIGVVQSCFSTRNGTPRQPLLVTLARACLVFDSARVPPASLEGLAEYSHCWVIYVFHLNTDLEKLWKEPSRSKFKAKVRVPKLKGGRMGVFATRTPHRPCPIGLTVAKVEAVRGNMVLLSGVDLVDGTPILDIKPYLPYCDCIQGAKVPAWVTVDDMLTVASVSFAENFFSSLVDCWNIIGTKTLYQSPDEFHCLIKQVLSWDIRSVSQRNQSRKSLAEIGYAENESADSIFDEDENAKASHLPEDVVYHLILEGIDVSYQIDGYGNVIVEKAMQSPHAQNGTQKRSGYLMWRNDHS